MKNLGKDMKKPANGPSGPTKTKGTYPIHQHFDLLAPFWSKVLRIDRFLFSFILRLGIFGVYSVWKAKLIVMKTALAALLAILCCGLVSAQSLIPAPWAFSSCSYGVSPIGWVNCNTSPDCAASRCTVPVGCAGQAVMCFGESFYYTLPTGLTVGQNYTVTMSVSVGQLGSASVVPGLHTFNVIGLLLPPTNCAGPYGNVCSTPGSTLLLSGNMTGLGWQTFTNTFTATSALRTIVIGNCDNTGNGGNLFCNFTLTPSVVFPVTLTDFSAASNGCEVNAQWAIGQDGNSVDRFELIKSVEGRDPEVVGTQAAALNRLEYSLVDITPSINASYQLRVLYHNGEASQSELIHVQSDCEDIQSAIEGNPVRGNEAILRFRHTGAAMMLTISNIEGRIVQQETIAADNAGWQRHRLDVSGLQPGIYFVRTGDGQVAKLQLMR
jgi:hypothetical protein